MCGCYEHSHRCLPKVLVHNFKVCTRDKVIFTEQECPAKAGTQHRKNKTKQKNKTTNKYRKSVGFLAFGLAQQKNILFEAQDCRYRAMWLRCRVCSCSCPLSELLHKDFTCTVSSQKHVPALTQPQHFNHF